MEMKLFPGSFTKSRESLDKLKLMNFRVSQPSIPYNQGLVFNGKRNHNNNSYTFPISAFGSNILAPEGIL